MASNHFGIELKNRLIELNLLKLPDCPIEGCTSEEIEFLKQSQGVDFLPETYVQFLEEMGQGAGLLFLGSDYTYNFLIVLKENALSTLKSARSQLKLPDDAFVFLMHQGYIFYYFHTKNLDNDPAIYGYKAGEKEFKLISATLSEHFNNSVNEML
jgi:hypothetical protein